MDIPAQNSLTALVIPTTDPCFKDKWEKSQGIEKPDLWGITKVYPEQEFTVLLILSGYGWQAQQVHVQYSYQLTDPEGKRAKNGNGVAYQGHLRQRQLLLSTELPQITIEPNALLGTYTLTVEFQDQLLNQTATYTLPIEVRSFESVPTIDTVEKLSLYMSTYYQYPKPAELIPAFLTFCQIEHEEQVYQNGICFFREALKDAAFLFPELLRVYASTRDQLQRSHLLCLLTNCTNAPTLSEIIKEEDLPLYHEFQSYSIPELSTLTLTHPDELDLVWAGFYANGKYTAIHRLLQLIDQSPISKTTAPGDPDDLTHTAAWSLQAHASKHKYVRIYLAYSHQHTSASEQVKTLISQILQPNI